MSAARLRAEEAKTRYLQAQRDFKANVDGPIKQDLLSALRAQRSALNDQIAQKRGVLGDRHPDLVMLASQLNDINRQIDLERKRNIESAKSEYEALLEQQKSLEGQLKSVENRMLTDGQAMVKLQELQRDADANRNIYEQFLSRFKATSEQRLLQSTQTKVASLATPPVRSTRPPLALLLAGMLIASLLISTAVVAMLDARTDTAEPEPALEPKLEPRVAAAPGAAEPRPEMPIWVRIPNQATAPVSRTVWQKPISATTDLDVSSHLGALLDKITAVPGSRGKIALVTSIERGVGSSTVARSLNLAAVRGGMLSVLIQVQPDAVIASKAAAEQTPPDELRTSRAGLRSVSLLLNAGQDADGRTGDDIRDEFDLIVIDARSLAEQPEVASLSAHADLVILVVRDGATDATAIRGARAALSKSGAAAIGIVVNQVGAHAVRPQRQNETLGIAS